MFRGEILSNSPLHGWRTDPGSLCDQALAITFISVRIMPSHGGTAFSRAPRRVQMDLRVDEWVVAGIDRRLLCQPHHLLHTLGGYSLYAYGDVFAPGGRYLGHIDGLDDHEGLPFELQSLLNRFVKYWHNRGDLDMWDDDCRCVVRLE